MLRLTFCCLCAMFVLSFAAPRPAVAQTREESPQQPGWSVNCANRDGSLSCEALQTITMRKTRQHLLSVSVRRNPEGAPAAMLLHLPHGLFLPAGLEIKVDGGEAKALPVQTCDARGCYAGTTASEVDITAMQKGAIFAVSFQNLKKETITVNVPLAGFTAAYDKLK